jgi:hypothetical protein
MKYTILPHGTLAIEIETEEDREFLKNSIDTATHKDHGVLADLLEYTGWEPNGRLYRVAPESISALTDAPILSDEVIVLEDGTQAVRGSVWWFPQYEQESFAETLLSDGYVVFTKAPD